MRTARKAIGNFYHPYDLQTGNARTPEELQKILSEQFTILEQEAVEARLKESAKKNTKGEKIASGLVTTQTFFLKRLKSVLSYYLFLFRKRIYCIST